MTDVTIRVVDEEAGAFMAQTSFGEVSMVARVVSDVIYGGTAEDDLLTHLMFDLLDEQSNTGVFVFGSLKFVDGLPSLTQVEGTPGIGEVSLLAMGTKPFDRDSMCRQLEAAGLQIKVGYRDAVLGAIRKDIKSLQETILEVRRERDGELSEARELVSELEGQLARARADLSLSQNRCQDMDRLQASYDAFVGRLSEPGAPSL